MSAPDESLTGRARRWRGADPDPTTRAQLDELLGGGDLVALESHVGTRLRFGTAGLRGPLGPGPNRMNRLLVRFTARAIAAQLVASVPDAARRGVVVGGDARHGSHELVQEVVDALAGEGVDVRRFADPVPTPLVVFAVSDLGAAAGIVITASHNPREDNGMKVVWADGAQINAPVDAAIDARIDERCEELFSGRREADPPTVPPDRVHVLGHEVTEAYLTHALGLLAPDPPWVQRPLRVAATALHGVGAALAQRAFERRGDLEVHWVGSQRRPDPDFPTAPIPNPEEPGVLDAVVELAASLDADVALALDPDADRLAVAVPDGDTWRRLSGDEVGVLLLAHLLERTDGLADRLVATTVVSTRLAATMCRAAGVHHAETLTGFKWLCRPALAHPHWHQVLIFEEALGYGIGPDARDKDGIVAALVVTELLLTQQAHGGTLTGRLDELARRHGAHVQLNGSVRAADRGAEQRQRDEVGRLVAAPPGALGGVAVDEVDRPASDVLVLHLADDTRVVVRPSGTEPKVKYYAEAVEPPASVERLGPAAARAAAGRRLEPVVDDLRRRLGG